jgi:hypothetical protein
VRKKQVIPDLPHYPGAACQGIGPVFDLLKQFQTSLF